MFLTADELRSTYYPDAANMSENDVAKFLTRANAYCSGIVGGVPPFSDDLPADGWKTAVGLAFEILTKGESHQVNPVNGDITPAAPQSSHSRPSSRMYDPFETVKAMLIPYQRAYAAANASKTERGFTFL